MAAPAKAAVPTHQPVDLYDLSDLLTDAARPTSNLITITVNPDGTVAFALPRAEVGQGITTAVAMTIAEEMDVPVGQGARHARGRPPGARLEPDHGRVQHDALDLHSRAHRGRGGARSAPRGCGQASSGSRRRSLTIRDGVITAPGGATLDDRLSERARRRVRERQRPGTAEAAVAVPGRRQAAAASRRSRHRDRPQAVRDGPRRGRRQADHGLPAAHDQRHGALGQEPRPGEGHARDHRRGDRAAHHVRGRRRGGPGRDVRPVHRRGPGAQRGSWGPARPTGKSDATVLAELKNAELPMVPPVTCWRRRSSRSSRSTSAPATRSRRTARSRTSRRVGAEIWSSLKTPIWAQEQIALNLGIPITNVKVHVTEGGGSFGRHLFCRRRLRGRRDLAEARQAREAHVAPHRQLPAGPRPPDDHLPGPGHLPRRERAHLRAAQHGVATDWGHGFGEVISAMGATPPGANLGYSQADLHPHRKRALRLRRGHAAPQRDLRGQHLQHQRRPQRLQPRRHYAARAAHRSARQGDGAGRRIDSGAAS